MEGLLAYEDSATIIASIYVEHEQSEEIIFEEIHFFLSLETNSVGLSGTEKGLYDLGTYFGR